MTMVSKTHRHTCMAEDCGKEFDCGCPDQESNAEEAMLSSWEIFCDEHREE